VPKKLKQTSVFPDPVWLSLGSINTVLRCLLLQFARTVSEGRPCSMQLEDDVVQHLYISIRVVSMITGHFACHAGYGYTV
jgi:hypothetical protein